MSGQTYSVEVVYQGKDRGASSMADSIGGRLVGLQSRVDSLVGAFNALGGVAAGIGGSAAMVGLGALYRGVTSLNARAEETTLTIAGMLNANGAAPSIAVGMADAAGTLRQIRRDAAALPGEAHEFVTVFQTALPAALQAGMRNGLAVSAFTNQFGAVGRSMGVDAEQIGRDLRFMLQGHAGGQVAMWNHLGPLIGKSAKDFNAMTAPARLHALQAVTARYGGMVSAFGGTWGAATSTITSAGQELLRIGTAPLFESAKGRVIQLADYLTAHGPQMEATAARLGQRLAHGFELGFERAEHLFNYVRNNWDRIVAAGRRDMVLLARDYAGLQMGSAAIGGARAFGGAFGGVSAALGGGGGGIIGGAVGGVGAVAASMALVAAAPAVVALASGSYDASRIAQAFGDSMVGAGTSANELRQVWQPLTTQIGGETLEGIRVMTGAVGSAATALLGIASFGSQVGNEFSGSRAAMDGFGRSVYTATVGLLSIPSILGRISNDWQTLQTQAGWNVDRHLMGSGNASQRADAMRTMVSMVDGHRARNTGPAYDLNEAHSSDGGSFWRLNAAQQARYQRDRPNTRAHSNHTVVHANFKIEQADNPERVALTVVHLLQRELRNPTQSRIPGITTLRGL